MDVDGRWWWLRLHAAFILGLMDDTASGRLPVHLMRRLAAGEDEDIEDWPAGTGPPCSATEHWLTQYSVCHQLQHDQQPANTSVAVEKRVNGFELRVDKRRLEQRRHGVRFIIEKSFQ